VPESSYPSFAGKHAGEAMFTAADFVAYLQRVGARDQTPAPGGVVLCYQRSLYDHVLRAEGLAPSRRGLPVALPSTGGRVGLLGQFGIGAPAFVISDSLPELVWSTRFHSPVVASAWSGCTRPRWKRCWPIRSGRE
jgi:hypothetical protein